MFRNDMWYFELDGGQQGPEDTAQLQARLERGEISAETLVWREGMGDWVPLSQVPELQGESPTEPVQAATTASRSPYSPPQQMQQGVPNAALVPHQNGLALTSMILGICSVPLMMGCFVGIILAIPAVIMGHISKGQIRKSGNMQTGNGFALTGIITGYVVIGLTVIMGILMGIAIATDEGL